MLSFVERVDSPIPLHRLHLIEMSGHPNLVIAKYLCLNSIEIISHPLDFAVFELICRGRFDVEDFDRVESHVAKKTCARLIMANLVTPVAIILVRLSVTIVDEL